MTGKGKARRIGAAVVASLAAVVGSVSPVAGQTVVGVVVEEGTARPLMGAFVVLEDGSGTRHQGVLAGADGRFVLRAGSPGRYRLVAELIGYASTRTEPLALRAGETVERRLEVPVQAVSLDGIQVETGSRCRRRPGSGPATARLWEEARKALEVARWSESQRVLRFGVVQYRRELDARTLRVTKQEERGRQGYYDQSPYRSIPAEALDEGGYIQAAPDGTLDYYAPDAGVLLSESFLSTHCFRVEESDDDPGLVGLGFEPVPERDRPDIRGVLWLERGTGELERLDFRYVNAPPPFGDWPQVGGRVVFERLATGMWIVRRWRIRMPLEARSTGGYGGSAPELTLASLVEEGAEVRSARTPDGRVLSEAAGAVAYGVAHRAPGGDVTAGAAEMGRETDAPEPLAGATVEVAPLGRTARTGPDGAWRLTGLPDGRFTIVMRHPDLELLGLAPVQGEVELVSGRATRLPMDAGLTPARAAELCAGGRSGSPGAAAGAEPVVVFGRVTDPAAEVPVQAALVRYEVGAGSGTVVTDSVGAFVLCAPAGARVALAAVEPTALRVPLSGLDAIELESTARSFLRADLELRRAARPMAAAGRRSLWQNAVIGTILEEGSREPVGAATVALLDSAGARVAVAIADERGRFTLRHPGVGSAFRVRVERLGYATSESALVFEPGQEVRLEVLVSTRPLELEPVTVTERRRGLLVDAGFYKRLEAGGGAFIQREEIERRSPSRTTDLLQGVPGMRLVQLGTAGRDVRLTGTVTLGDMATGCQPKVYVDGILMRPGGEMRMIGPNQPDPNELLDQIVAPREIEALEIYRHPSEIPPQYGGPDAACGVLVIWTRRGG